MSKHTTSNGMGGSRVGVGLTLAAWIIAGCGVTTRTVVQRSRSDTAEIPRGDDATLLPLDRDPPGYHPRSANQEARSVSHDVRAGGDLQWERSLATLPRLESVGVGGTITGGSFDLHVRPGGYRLLTEDKTLAEIEIGSFRAFTWAELRAPKSQAVPRRWDSIAGPECGPSHSGPGLDARWRGVSLDGWTSSSVPFVEYIGTYDTTTCRGLPTEARRTVAVALWPGVIYAFESEPTGDGVPAKVHLLSAAAEWLSAFPLDPKDELRPVVGSFSYVAVSRKTRASVTLSMSDTELVRFSSLIPGATRLKSDAATSEAANRPSVRVIADIDPTGRDGGVIRMTVEKLTPSKVVEALLEDRASKM